jgi:hypothetical protein
MVASAVVARRSQYRWTSVRCNAVHVIKCTARVLIVATKRYKRQKKEESEKEQVTGSSLPLLPETANYYFGGGP